MGFKLARFANTLIDNDMVFLLTESKFRMLNEIGTNLSGSLLMLKSGLFTSMRKLFIPAVELLAMDGKTQFSFYKS